MTNHKLKRQVFLLSACLVLLIAVAFEPVRHNDFVQYDDETYITQNPPVLRGITSEGIRWAFTANNMTANWHPLTWLSHMIDVELFGLNPLGHHLHNLFLHTLSTILLWGLFFKMTGTVWPGFFVALVFGIHPLRVESVAWAAERKDVLSMFFFMLTVASYLYYINRRGIFRYLLVVFCFTLGLMAKPMLVTVPIVLLILDFWPLKNYHSKTPVRLIVEKIPLFILTIISCIITYRVQQSGGSMMTSLPLHFRISNALFSYVGYAGKMLWPVNLGVLYPYSIDRPLWHIAAASILLLAITFFVIYRIRTSPWLAAGWFWYIITLFPVIGIVQVGLQASADRYTYLPSIGITTAIVWEIVRLSEKWKFRKTGLGITGSALTLAMIIGTRMQLTYWKDAVTLFEHTLSVTQNNVIMHSNLAVALERQNKPDLAAEHAQKAIAIQPQSVDANNNMAIILTGQRRYDQALHYASKALEIQPDNIKANNAMAVILTEYKQFDRAISCLQKALEIQPDDIETNNNMAAILVHQGQFDRAEGHLLKVLQVHPDSAEANLNMADVLIHYEQFDIAANHVYRLLNTQPNDAAVYYRLGIIREGQGQLEQAVTAYQKAIRLDPNHSEAWNNLGIVYGKKDFLVQAVECFQQSLRMDPNSAEACHNLAFALRIQGQLDQAMSYYRRAAEIEPNNYKRFWNLASCLYTLGKSQEAIQAVQKAIELAGNSGQTEMVETMEQRLEWYRTGKPWDEPAVNQQLHSQSPGP